MFQIESDVAISGCLAHSIFSASLELQQIPLQLNFSYFLSNRSLALT